MTEQPITSPAPDEGRVAIIGMAGRFPGAESVGELWELLLDGREAISWFTDEELRASAVPADLASRPGYVPAKGVLADVAGFDARLFGYSAVEASVLDPQQRVFLECAWVALEDAGCDPDRFDAPIAVYAGSLLSTYLMHNLLPRTDLQASLGIPMLFQGNQPDQLAPRVAYKLNLRGPAITVQTACSTSLVAVHLAVQSLLTHECDLALAGGVTVTVPHRAGYLPVAGGIESPDGRCRPFGSGGSGTVFGNGAGVVVLKRLADARADGDRVHALILGSAVNNDGARKAGFTAPSVPGQTAVIREALSIAAVAPASIGYVEAHGTGTAIGDPIEVAALTAGYGPAGGAQPWCAIGSVKSNLGHLDAAAGIAGLIKAVLAVRHGKIPASLHASPPNPALELSGSPFFLADKLMPWPLAQGPRRAAVSAFGIGGTNAHVILEEPPPAGRDGPAPDGQPTVVPLSAATPTALETLASRIADDLARHPGRAFGDIVHTLRTGRRQLAHRRAVIATDVASTIAALRGGAAQDTVGARASTGPAPVAFLLPGQGAQFPAMAMGLHEAYPIFRDALDECARLLKPHLGRDLVEVLHTGDAAELRQTSITQPAVLAVSYSLAVLWQHWGVRPAAMFGHSLGEYTAALLAGVFTLPDALGLVAARGRLLGQTAPGAMLAVPMQAEDAADIAASFGLDLAAVNGLKACVISGTPHAVGKVQDHLAGLGLTAVRLAVEHAFHSALCDPVVDEFAALISSVKRQAPARPFVSGVTGQWITAAEATSGDYWARQLRLPVQFLVGAGQLLGLDEHLVLSECGPGSTLTDLVRAGAGAGARLVPAPLPRRRPAGPDAEVTSFARSTAALWAHGAAITWPRVDGARVARLPAYPFERLPHWVESAVPGSSQPAPHEPPAAAPERRALQARLVWRPAEGGDSNQDPLTGRRLTWLLMLDQQSRAQAITDLLTSRGQIVTTVCPGPGYRRVARGAYEIDPADAAQYGKLLADLRGLVRTPTAVLYAWGLARTPGTGEDWAYFGLIRLARALSAERVVNRVRLGVLTANAFAALPGSRPDPAAALLSGPAQVLGAEYANLGCVHVDLPEGAVAGREAAAQVVRLVLSPPAPLLAIREGRVLRRALVPCDADDRPGAPARESRLPHAGVYLITGGLGGLGLALAGYLARAHGARIALLGRRAAPSEHDAGEVADALRDLRAAGTQIVTVQADVTDPAAVERALQAVRDRLGPIDVVIHAAGVPGGGSIERRSDDDMRAVLAPKTTGVRTLLGALRPDEARLLVFCSSLATLIPTYGQADYTAANAYLAALAEASAGGDGRHVVAADWDMWADAGMAAAAQAPADLAGFQQLLLAGALTREQGTQAFASLIEGAPGRVVVARAGAEIDPSGTLDLHVLVMTQPAPTRHPRPDLPNSYVAPRTPTEERLAEIYGEMFGVDAVGVEDDFLDLGGHSLLAAQVAARLRADFAVDLPARLFFEGGRVADLAAEIEELIIAELDAR